VEWNWVLQLLESFQLPTIWRLQTFKGELFSDICG
jgi:hypothetical protein